MGCGFHFSLDQLPERYRAQVVRDTLGLGGGQAPSGGQAEGGGVRKPGNPGKPGKRAKSGRCRAPVCLPRAAAGPNRTEARFNRDVLLGRGKYEAITLRLPSGVKYTPDFVFEYGGKVYLAEVKGGYRLPTHGRSVMAFKVACSEFPMFRFVFAELRNGGRTWRVGVYEGGTLVHTEEGTAQELHGMGGRN